MGGIEYGKVGSRIMMIGNKRRAVVTYGEDGKERGVIKGTGNNSVDGAEDGTRMGKKMMKG